MNNLTIAVLLLFGAWIVLAFVLAQRRLNNAYRKYQNGDYK